MDATGWQYQHCIWYDSFEDESISWNWSPSLKLFFFPVTWRQWRGWVSLTLSFSPSFLPFSVGQLCFLIRQRVSLRPEEALFFFVNNSLPPSSSPLSAVYEVSVHSSSPTSRPDRLVAAEQQAQSQKLAFHCPTPRRSQLTSKITHQLETGKCKYSSVYWGSGLSSDQQRC